MTTTYITHDICSAECMDVGRSAQITTRSQVRGVKPRSLYIEPEVARHYDVIDVTVGNRSQLPQSTTGIPASQFSHGAGAEWTCDELQTAMDFVMVVTRKAVAKMPQARRAELVFKSTRAVRKGEFVTITDLPRRLAIRPDGLRILNGERWLVDNLTIGLHSQFNFPGPIPGDMFAKSAIDSYVSYETAGKNTDITIRAQYVGDEPDGEDFKATLVGVVPDFDEENEAAPKFVATWQCDVVEPKAEPSNSDIMTALERLMPQPTTGGLAGAILRKMGDVADAAGKVADVVRDAAKEKVAEVVAEVKVKAESTFQELARLGKPKLQRTLPPMKAQELPGFGWDSAP